jgi:hypothetical protein
MIEIKFEGILNGSNKTQDVYKKTVNYVTKEFESEIQSLSESKEVSEINLSKQNIEFKLKLLSEKEDSFKELSKQKNPIERQAEYNFNFFKFKFILAII